MSTTVTYKGRTLTTAENQTRKLNTAGQYLEDDVTITDVSPSGSTNINSNGTHNVKNFETANVAVPNSYSASDEGKVVSGRTLVSQTSDTVTANDTYDTTLINSLTVNVPSGTPSLQNKSKTYTPSESQQTDAITADSGYDGLGEVDVTVEAVSSSYVGTAVTRRSSSDLTANGATVTAPAGYYASQATKSVASGTAGTPTATKGTVSNHSVTVTPSVQNTTGYIQGGTKTGTAVTVSASELVSGSETKTSNGTYDVTNLAELVVNVSGGGGASNFVHGEFTTQSSAGVQTVNIPYTGSGYPIMAYIVIKGGAYVSGTDWYNSMQRYAIGVWACSKSVMSSAPTYGTSGTQNQAVTMSIYKNSTSSSTSYTRTSAMNTNTYTSSNATNAAATAVRFKSNAKTLSIYVNTSSYGFLPNQDYEYFIVYSS